MDELSQWRTMSDKQQEQKIEEIQGIRSTHACSQCGKPAFCEISAGKSTCWCFELNKRDISTLEPGACVCRQCLEKLPML